MSEYENIYTGREAISVLPWVLPHVELLPEGEVPYASGPVLRASMGSNGSAPHRLVRAIPSGFITGTFMEVDLSSGAAIAGFCDSWGLVAAPYAGGIARMTARLVDDTAEERFLRDAYEADDAELPERALIDCERYGRDIWYNGLNSSERDLAVKGRLNGNCWLNAFGRDSTSKGGEVLNAYLYSNRGAESCSLVYVEEVRHVLSIMRVAVLANGFLELAKGDCARALAFAVKFDDACERNGGSGRPFEDALSLFMNPGFLHYDGDVSTRKALFSSNFETIEENTLLFADLCLSAVPEPLVAHGGFRRGALVDAKMPDAGGNARYGSLLQAMAAQFYAYLNDGLSWKVCGVCGRPFKYEQQVMSPITSESAAKKEYACRHHETKTSFCSKRHEKQVYSKRNAKTRARKEASKKEREEKGTPSV